MHGAIGRVKIGRPERRWYLLAFPCSQGTLFVSALLLFAVQPMFTKMVLPSARRFAGGVVRGDGLFPGAAADWLYLGARAREEGCRCRSPQVSI